MDLCPDDQDSYFSKIGNSSNLGAVLVSDDPSASVSNQF